GGRAGVGPHARAPRGGGARRGRARRHGRARARRDRGGASGEDEVSAMIVTLKQGADEARVRGQLARRGLWVGASLRALDGTVHLPVSEGSSRVRAEDLSGVDGISTVATSASPHPLVDRHGPTARVGAAVLGPRAPALVAGPCSVESEAQIQRIAGALAGLGVTWLRGGAFKPRTSPYAFQGAGDEAL